MTPQEKWLKLEERLESAAVSLGEITPMVFIPGWDPVDYAMGKRWAQSQIYEAYYVDFKLTEAGIHFKTWEYGEPEPEFRE